MTYQEQPYINEEERKKQKKSKQEHREEQENLVLFEKKKAEIREEEKTALDLQKLKELLEAHVIDNTLIESIIQKTVLDHKKIEEIFKKITEVESLKNIDKYLPKDMRVTQEEYARATHDATKRRKVMEKIENCLTLLAQNISPQTWASLNLFWDFMFLLDKNLILIQEHHIDMKDALQ